jgi:hypothetical protein
MFCPQTCVHGPTSLKLPPKLAKRQPFAVPANLSRLKANKGATKREPEFLLSSVK